MGLFDLLKPNRRDVTVTRSALDEARDPTVHHGAVEGLINNLLHTGIDGRGPFKGAAATAAKAFARTGDPEAAIDRVVRNAVAGAATGGAVTSVGGFVTMPVAVPVNVLEFYLQATRMVASIAKLRGYDIQHPDVRSAVLLTLAGSHVEDVLAKAGLSSVTGGTITGVLRQRLPDQALMLINKAVGFQVLKNLGEKTLARFGKAIPLVGGAIGGGLDAYLINKIADEARKEFPPLIQGSTVD